ncbi:MAG: nucleoside triphosphate pyrophosphohydrolase [FCB group bacterium]|nr:nucleoside triphosphate pyrophosphohydrolase [FCB group bacterium]
MEQLRSENGCPWDKEQTHKSLRPYLIEEAYEVLSALDEENMPALKGELGDLLLQIVFHAQIAKETEQFNFDDVAQSIVDKLIQRHPHVFGDVKVNGSAEVLENWEAIKMNNEKRSLFSGVPDHLPALLSAYRVQEKAASVGFDWPDIYGIEDKLNEEWQEFEAARKTGDKDKMEEEFGDMLFALVNLGKWLGIDAELALNRTVKKFINRFHYVEEKLAENGTNPVDSNLEDMDKFWEDSKDKIKS